MKPGRTTLSVLLLVAFAASLAVAQLLIYADRNLFDSGRFADHAVAALEEDDVREQAADGLTRAVLAANGDAIAVEPVIRGVANGVVASSAFRTVVRGAVYQAHSAVFGKERDALVLTLSDAGVLLIQTLESLNPAAAAAVPKGLEATLLSVSDGDAGAAFTDVAQVAEDAGSLGWVLLAIAALLALAAVLAARDRRRGIRNLGIALAAQAALVVLVLVIARGLVAGQAPEAQGEAALRAIWGTFFGDLFSFQIGLLVAGLVIAATAESLLRPVGVAERARRLSGAVARTPARTPLRALRAVLLVVVGVLVLIDPFGALRLAALAAGLLLVTLGVEEILFMTARDDPEPAPDRGRARPGLRRTAVVVGLCAVALAVPALVLASTDGAEGENEEVVACNGARELCGRRIDRVAIPATHNSMSAPDAKFLFPDQDSGIAAQLTGGIRGLLIDTHMGVRTSRGVFTVLAEGGKSRGKIEQALGPEATASAERLRDRIGSPEGRPTPWLCHGFCELGARPAVAALEEIREFLVANPGEVLVISLEDQITPRETERIFEESGLLDLVWKGSIDPAPTLGEMVERNERVLVFGEEETEGFPWYHQQFDFAVETPFDVPSAKRLLDPRSCAAGRGEVGAPIVVLNQFVARTPPRPSEARKVNAAAAVVRRARGCEAATGGEANLIAVDFWREGDVVAAAARLNGVRG